MAAPTLISYTETSWTTQHAANAAVATASVTWQTGDVVVILGGSEGAVTTTAYTPTAATGLAWGSVQQYVSGGGSNSDAFVWAAVASSGSSGTITVTASGQGSTSDIWGFAVWVWRGSAGIGNSTKIAGTTAHVNLALGGGADGAVVWGVFDWSASTVLTLEQTPTNTRQRSADGTAYTYYVADLADQASTSSLPYGLTTNPTGPVAIVVLEIKAGVSSDTTEWRGCYPPARGRDDGNIGYNLG